MQLVREKIKSIKKIQNDSKRYDLEVKNNHNFFANSILVHNCTTMHRDYIHARSLDSADHESRSWVKHRWSEVRFDIPDDMKIVGENLYAKHSVAYKDLKSYFYVFGIYQEVDLDLVCLSWADTEMWCSLLGLEHVPVIYQGTYRAFDQKKHVKALDLSVHEGYVIRNTDRFLEKDFDKNVAKWVRANHVQTDEHWMSKKVEKNLLHHE